MIYTMEDIGICARTVCGEARGEGDEGMRAVAHVMVNRLRSTRGQFKKDDTLASACLRHAQFSVWNPGDPNFEPMQEYGPHQYPYRRALAAVLDAIDAGDDPTNGALWYCTNRARPRWARGKTPCARIGNHKFYDNIDWKK